MTNANLFLCCTHFHFYVALAIAWDKYQNGQKNTIVLSLTKNQIPQGLSEQLHSIYWTRIIDLTDQDLYRDIEKKSFLKKIILNLFLTRQYPSLFPRVMVIENQILTDRIFLFNDFHYLARYIIKKCSQTVILMEDGNNNYAPIKKSLLTYFKILIDIYPRFGRHPRISQIMVQKPDELPGDIRSKGKLLYLNHFLNQMPTTVNQHIISLFIDSLETVFEKNVKGSVLLLTQPYYEFGRINLTQHIQLFDTVIKQLKAHHKKIYLKPHPSDRVDYLSLFSDITILPATFPIEILNHTDVFKPDTVMGINTSAVFNLKLSNRNLNLLPYDDRFIQHHFDESIQLIEKTLIQNLSNQGFVKRHA
jgi:hypothetical protein